MENSLVANANNESFKFVALVARVLGRFAKTFTSATG